MSGPRRALGKASQEGLCGERPAPGLTPPRSRAQERSSERPGGGQGPFRPEVFQRVRIQRPFLKLFNKLVGSPCACRARVLTGRVTARGPGLPRHWQPSGARAGAPECGILSP